MSAKMFHVALVLKQSLGVLAQQCQVIVFSKMRELALCIAPRLGDLRGVYQTMDVWRNLLVSFEVGKTVD